MATYWCRKISHQAHFTLHNTGSEVLLHVHAEEKGDRYWMEAEEQFLTLFQEKKGR